VPNTDGAYEGWQDERQEQQAAKEGLAGKRVPRTHHRERQRHDDGHGGGDGGNQRGVQQAAPRGGILKDRCDVAQREPAVISAERSANSQQYGIDKPNAKDRNDCNQEEGLTPRGPHP